MPSTKVSPAISVLTSPQPTNIQPSAEAALPTAVAVFPEPTADTRADVLNVIFTDGGNPDRTTVLLYLLANSGTWISTSTKRSRPFSS